MDASHTQGSNHIDDVFTADTRLPGECFTRSQPSRKKLKENTLVDDSHTSGSNKSNEVFTAYMRLPAMECFTLTLNHLEQLRDYPH